MGKGNYVTLSGIFLIALAFRTVTMKFKYLMGNDPWAHYKASEQVLMGGGFHSLLSYSVYPYEAYVKVPAGLDYFPVYLHKLMGFTGISFYNTFQILPSIFGAFAILPLYLLVRELYNERAALLSALFIAVTPAGIERGLAGFYRGDVFMVFTMLFAFYFFVCSVKKNIYASPIAGIFLFLGAFFWDGWPFAFATLFLAFVLGMIANYTSGRSSHRLIISHTISCVTGLFLIYVFKERYYAFSFNNMVWNGFRGEIELVFILFILASSFSILHFMSGKRAGARIFAPVPVLLLIVAALYGSGYLFTLWDFVKNFGVWSSSFIPQATEVQNIAELQKPSLSYIFSRFVSLILLAPLGLLLLAGGREKFDFNRAFSLAFVLSALYVLTAATRFSFLASPAISLLGAVSILYILSMDLRKIMIVCVSLLLLTNVNASIDFTENYKPVVYDELFDALTWLNKETPSESIVLTWWSYTGPVQAIAERMTLFGTYPSVGLMGEVSEMFVTSDEKKALGIARRLKADYILMDKHIYDLSPNYMFYTDEPLEPFNSTLFKLYRGKSMERFKLVFKNSRVKIYKPLYNYTRIQDVKTKRRFFESNEYVDVNTEIRSNENTPATLLVKIYDPGEVEIFSKEYAVTGNSTINTAFYIPSNPIMGTYLIAASLRDSHGNRIPPTVYRTFVVTGYKYGETNVVINASAKYDPHSDTLVISGKITGQNGPLANEELFIWQDDEVWEAAADKNGEFERAIKDAKWNKAFYVYTRDKSGFAIVFANIDAQIISDFALSKYHVKRGETVKITYTVKNNANFPFEGYLAVDDIKIDNKNARLNLFTDYIAIPYKIEPGETASFNHTFTVKEDAPTGRYRIWRAMWDKNLKMWIGPMNKDGQGFEAEIVVS